MHAVMKVIGFEPGEVDLEAIKTIKQEAKMMALMQGHGERDFFPVFLAGYEEFDDFL
jgi:hypothetical protein